MSTSHFNIRSSPRSNASASTTVSFNCSRLVAMVCLITVASTSAHVVGAAAAPTTTMSGPSSCYDYLLPEAPNGSDLTVDQINAILTAHNDARRSVYPPAKSMPMLQWDHTLASFAKNHRQECKGLVYTSNEERTSVGGFAYVGENIAAGSLLDPQHNGGAIAVGLWVQQQQSFTYPSCPQGQPCGSYQQVIWADTTRVGCGYAACGGVGVFYWSCVYGAGGNYIGEAAYEAATGPADADKCSNGGVTMSPTTNPQLSSSAATVTNPPAVSNTTTKFTFPPIFDCYAPATSYVLPALLTGAAAATVLFGGL